MLNRYRPSKSEENLLAFTPSTLRRACKENDGDISKIEVEEVSPYLKTSEGEGDTQLLG